MVGVRQGTAERQHDAAPQRFGDASRPLAELTLNNVVLFEVGVRRVQHQRLASAKLVLEYALETREPPFREPRGDVDPFALARIEIDVEMLGLEDLEVELFVLDFVLSKVLGRNRRVDADDEHKGRGSDRGSAGDNDAHDTIPQEIVKIPVPGGAICAPCHN